MHAPLTFLHSGHKHLRPKSIHDPEILDEFSKDYMYLACIKFIDSVRLTLDIFIFLNFPPNFVQIKTASLRWHSPMLDDISAVKTWDKVNSGMIKMYCAEVLGKLPVIQHFLFGSFLPWDGPLPAEPTKEEDEHWGHGHAKEEREVGWGDCCGIPVPSAFGAVQADNGRLPGVRLAGPGIRPIPFD